MIKPKLTIFAAAFAFCFLIGFSYLKLATPRFLTFSDSAKYADAGRYLSENGFPAKVHHSFFDKNLLPNYVQGSLWSADLFPLPIVFFAGLFKIFPPSDFVVETAGLSIFALTGAIIFWLAFSKHSLTSGIISIILFAFNLNVLDYSVNSTTEIFFMLEISLLAFLISKKFPLNLLTIIPMTTMFLTRYQALLVLIALGITIPLQIKSSIKTRTLMFLGVLSLIALSLIISKRFQLSPISPLKTVGSFHVSTETSQANILRGAPDKSLNLLQFSKKVLYNLYNFIRSPERIAPPLVLGFFLIGLFNKQKPEIQTLSRLSVISLTLFLLASSATIPNARYIHPLNPLLIILSAISMAEHTKSKKLGIYKLIVIVSLTLISPIGHIFVDYRFRNQFQNIGMPPIYKIISDKLSSQIPPGKLIVTNLDAWAGWYHGLTTMWFPLSPEVLESTKLSTNPVDFIAISNYLEDSKDFSLGGWKDVLYKPDSLSPYLASNYAVLSSIKINPSENYENQDIKLVILQKNKQ